MWVGGKDLASGTCFRGAGGSWGMSLRDLSRGEEACHWISFCLFTLRDWGYWSHDASVMCDNHAKLSDAYLWAPWMQRLVTKACRKRRIVQGEANPHSRVAVTQRQGSAFSRTRTYCCAFSAGVVFARCLIEVSCPENHRTPTHTHHSWHQRME